MFRKKNQKKNYDANTKKPVIKCSICTGEQVAGFKDLQTGKFFDEMLIKSEKDLKLFMETYDLQSIEKEY